MDNLLQLSKEEIDILVKDSEKDLIDAKVRLMELTIDRDIVRKNIKLLEEEKEYLELLRSGVDFNEHLTKCKPDTINTIQRKYLKLLNHNQSRDQDFPK